jgi:uncharacterized protein YkwD
MPAFVYAGMDSLTLLTTLVLLMNAARADARVPPLVEDPALQARAQARAERLCADQQFTHDGYEGAYKGLTYRWKGENLAKGHRDARSVHAQLMASPGHRANILRREFNAVGIGSACDITVELFGGR